MQYYDSFAKQVIFNNQFGNPVAGIPLSTCVQNEMRTERAITGGSLHNDPMERFSDLVIPAGLYMHSYVDPPPRMFKKNHCKPINPELFEELMNVVTKPLKYNSRQTMKRKHNK
jgi:hypothetical protein